MNLPNNFLSTLRQESEESWRQRLEDAYKLYQIANARYRRLLEKAPEGQLCDQDEPLARARDAESEALVECTRLLKIVTNLRVHGGEGELESRARTANGKT